MVYGHHLQRNTGLVDPLIFSDHISDSYFWYHGYSTTKNFFKVRKDIQPAATPAFGGQSNFKMPHIGDKQGPLQLMFTLGTLTAGGGGAHPPRYEDFVGFTVFEKIEITYSNNELYVLTSEELFETYRKTKGIEKRDAQAEIIAGDKSALQRETLALAPQEMIIDLPFPHTRGTSRWWEIIQMAQEPRFTVHWRRLENIVQLGGAVNPVASLTNLKLRATYMHLVGDERDANTGRTEAEDGIIRLYDEYTFEEAEIPSGTPAGDFLIQMRNFRTSTKRFGFMIRKKADLTTQNAANRFGDLQLLSSFTLEGADGKIIEPVEDRYSRFYLHPLYHEGPAGEFLYGWSWAMDPDDRLNATGSYNLGNSTNPTLRLTLAAATTEDLVVSMYAIEYNFQQHVRGDVLRNFK